MRFRIHGLSHAQNVVIILGHAWMMTRFSVTDAIEKLSETHMRILICGSRTVKITTDDISKVFDELDILPTIPAMLRNYPDEKTANMIISGNARGPDKAGIAWASKNLCGYTIVNAEWDKYGKSAGILRDKQMVEDCHTCIGFWDGKSRGTKFTLDYAKKKGRKTYVVDCSSYPIGKVHEYGEPEYKSMW
jgi:hypothetical protein